MCLQVFKRKPEERIKDFEEVILDIDKAQALKEAERCLKCADPSCVKACPLNIDIPGFIKLIETDKIREAYFLIKEKNPFPQICSRVCPQENICESACVLGKKSKPIRIGKLERYVSDEFHKRGYKEEIKIKERKEKIAVIGSGPAGLAASWYLRKNGFKVSCFEALHKLGGVLIYGIPSFRLPKEIVDREIETLKKMGVEFILNCLIGRTLTIPQLFKAGFKGVIIATGAGLPKLLNIKGEEKRGIYSANEFLMRVNLMGAHLFPKKLTPLNIGKTTIVIGGGNTAIDCARVALRLNSKVKVCYRRTKEFMPARIEEIEHAEEEGVEFNFLLAPKEFKGKDFVESVVFEKMELRGLDSTQRPKPTPTGEFLEIKTDSVIIAIGQSPNPLIYKTHPDLEVLDGKLKVNKLLETTVKRVYAAGDIVKGEASVVEAIAQGILAAKNLIKTL